MCLLLMLEGLIFVAAREGYALGRLHSVCSLWFSASTPAATSLSSMPDRLSLIGAACSGEILPNLWM